MVKAKPYSEIAIGLAFAAGGVGICFHAAGLRSMPGMAVGSGLFPMITGVGMGLFGLILAASAYAGAAPRESVDSLAGGDTGPHRSIRFLPVYSLAVLAALIVLTLAMPAAGFIPCSIAFTLIAARLGGAGWIGSAVFAVAITLILYGVFVHGLRVQLPRGMWGG